MDYCKKILNKTKKSDLKRVIQFEKSLIFTKIQSTNVLPWYLILKIDIFADHLESFLKFDPYIRDNFYAPAS